ncbi:hypothetical protein CEG14_08230 [Bordetella genomosp. 1]|uniref:PhoP regulatory network protein YrbL n=1 Tax=Bordetella genomosp. 1 TaxID=1395607 RepID=A0A261SQA1_9BORD|nr:hypothetical protein CEG14_08230 [Bordetella genomosp. 1]
MPSASAAPALPTGDAAAPGVQAVFGPIDLSGATPLAQGGDRYVFQHPHEPGLLIKVMDMQARAVYLQARPFKRWYKQFQRESAYRVYLNEFSEYVCTTTRPSGVWQVPMARILGAAQTSLGLGLLVERISDGNGGLAPTVADLARQGRFTVTLAAKLDEFFADLADAHLVIHDMSASNVACGYNAEGRPGLYLVDGFGVLPLIPIHAWSRLLNRRRVMRKYAALRARMPAPVPDPD